MILDYTTCFSIAQDLAQTAGNYLCDKSVDVGAAGTIPGNLGGMIKDGGRGTPVEVIAEVVTTFTSGGSATVQCQLVMADDAALSSNLTVLYETAAIAYATLTAGYQFRLGTIPPGLTKRYVGVRYVIAVATTTAGNVTAGIVMDKQTSPIV